MGEEGKRGRGRPPRPGGAKVSRSLRVDRELWETAVELAEANGETMTRIIEPAVERQLRRYIATYAGRVSS